MTETVELELKDIELIRSALRYYFTGAGYTVDPNSDDPGTLRRIRRKDRAGTLASRLDTGYPTTIDVNGMGDSVVLIHD